MIYGKWKIRTHKQTGLGAFRHLTDMKHTTSLSNMNSEKIPVIFVTVDGRSDKNSRYTQTINYSINNHFLPQYLKNPMRYSLQLMLQ